MKLPRLDIVLVQQGHAESRTRAQSLIMAGVVFVNEQKVDKPGKAIRPTDTIRVAKPDHPYVSRGGLKLEKALRHFNIDPTGLVCADIGASTGGFADILLQQGATHVYAVDVGYGQFAWKLRTDDRVTLFERTNARTMDSNIFATPIDLTVIDVSFISLTLILKNVALAMQCSIGTPIICLVKPQFEVGKSLVGKNGVVTSEEIRLSAVDKIVTWAQNNCFTSHEFVESPIQGPAGNHEYLLLLRTNYTEGADQTAITL